MYVGPLIFVRSPHVDICLAWACMQDFLATMALQPGEGGFLTTGVPLKIVGVCKVPTKSFGSLLGVISEEFPIEV